MKRPDASTGLTVVLTLLYPLAIWFGHDRIEAKYLAAILVAIAGVRLATLNLPGSQRWWGLAALALAGPAIWWNALLPLKLYPVLVNLGMFLLFGYSLLNPPSMIERMARIKDPVLPPFAIRYTYRVTQVWCIFFIFNGGVALATALWASEATWSLYNGAISYGLMGLLFAGEYVLRLRVRRRHEL